MCLLGDYEYVESSRKLSAVDVAVFILISVVFIICSVICSNVSSFPNFAVTLSVLHFYLQKDKTVGSSRRKKNVFLI